MKLIPFDHDKLSQYQYDDIEHLCKYLVKKRVSLTIIEFIKFVHQEFYSEMDISFLDYSLKICRKKNEFCVNPIEEFVNLRVKENKIRSNDLFNIIKKCELIEDEDYILLRRSPQQESKSHGGNNKRMYFLTPDSFKILLLAIDNKKQQLKFNKYFILLEKCVAYYDHNYQSVLVQKTIKMIEEKN